MILLDTDTLSLLFQGHAGVLRRMQSAEDAAGTTLITWIEVLRGRFDAIFKAADANELRRACERLSTTQQQFATLTIVEMEFKAAEAFQNLLRNKKFKKIGRGDLLIASIALSRKATLVTRNLKDFERIPGLALENWAD